MGWSDWSYWLKSGIIGLLFGIAYSLFNPERIGSILWTSLIAALLGMIIGAVIKWELNFLSNKKWNYWIRVLIIVVTILIIGSIIVSIYFNKGPSFW